MAEVKLGPIYIGADAPLTAAVSLTFNDLTFWDFVVVVTHSAALGKGVHPPIGAGRPPVVGAPFVSKYAAHVTLGTAASAALWHAPKRWLVDAHWRALKSVAGACWDYPWITPAVVAIAAPTAVVLRYAAPAAAIQLYWDTHSAVTGLFRQWNYVLPYLPHQVTAVYYNLKTALADKQMSGPQSTLDFVPADTRPEVLNPAVAAAASAVEDAARPPRSPPRNRSDTGLEICPVAYPVHDGPPRNACAGLVDEDVLDHTGVFCPKCGSLDFAKFELPKANCLFTAMSATLQCCWKRLWSLYAHENPRAKWFIDNAGGFEGKDIQLLALRLGVRIRVHLIRAPGAPSHVYGSLDGLEVEIDYIPGHYQQRKNCVVTALPENSTIKSLFERLQPIQTPVGAATMGLPTTLTWQFHSFNQKRAKDLFRALSEPRGLGLVVREAEHREKFARLVGSVDHFGAPRVKIAGLLGAAGCGKTQPILDAFKVLPSGSRDYLIVVPTQEARKRILAFLQLPKVEENKVVTWEFALLGRTAGLVLIDELGQFMPGFVDLYRCAAPTCRNIIFTADPAQDVWHSPVPHTINSAVPEVDVYAGAYGLSYNPTTHRQKCGVAHQIGLAHHCTSDPKDQFTITYSQHLDHSMDVIVGSDEEARTMSSVRNKAVLTVSGCQGATLRSTYEVVVTSALCKASDRAWYTILTRGTRGIRLVITAAPSQVQNAASRILRALYERDDLKIQAAIRSHIGQHIPANLLNPLTSGHGVRVVGAGELHVADKDENPRHDLLGLVAQLPHLQRLIPAAPNPDYIFPDVVNAYSGRPHRVNPSHASHFDPTIDLLANASAAVGTLLPDIRDKYARETVFDGVMTDQIPDDPLMGMFIQHRTKDKATEKWTFKERYVTPYPKGPCDEMVGAIAYTEFCKLMGHDQLPFDRTLWERKAADDIDRLLEKGVKALLNIAGRADPDWVLNQAEIFLKSQAVTKPGTIGREAKKGQMIISFSTEASILFGPLAKYIAAMLEQLVPKNVFLLDGKTQDHIQAFTQSLWLFRPALLRGRLYRLRCYYRVPVPDVRCALVPEPRYIGGLGRAVSMVCQPHHDPIRETGPNDGVGLQVHPCHEHLSFAVLPERQMGHPERHALNGDWGRRGAEWRGASWEVLGFCGAVLQAGVETGGSSVPNVLRLGARPRDHLQRSGVAPCPHDLPACEGHTSCLHPELHGGQLNSERESGRGRAAPDHEPTGMPHAHCGVAQAVRGRLWSCAVRAILGKIWRRPAIRSPLSLPDVVSLAVSLRKRTMAPWDTSLNPVNPGILAFANRFALLENLKTQPEQQPSMSGRKGTQPKATHTMAQCTNPNCRWHAGKGKWIAKPQKQRQQATPRRNVFSGVAPSTFTVTNRELGETSLTTAAVANGGTAFVIAVSKVAVALGVGTKCFDPSTLFGGIARNFDKYRLKALKIEIPAIFPQTQGGQIGVWFDPDPEIAGATPGTLVTGFVPSGVAIASGKSTAVIKSINESLVLNVPAKELKRIGGDAWYDVADTCNNITAFAATQIVGVVRCGWTTSPPLPVGSAQPQIWLTYTVEFGSPNTSS
jgi:hypothetical protein